MKCLSARWKATKPLPPTPPTNPSHQARHLCDENFFIDDEFFLVLDNPLE